MLSFKFILSRKFNTSEMQNVNARQEGHNLPETRGRSPEGKVQIMSE
jgi:hypothetical protein